MRYTSGKSLTLIAWTCLSVFLRLQFWQRIDIVFLAVWLYFGSCWSSSVLSWKRTEQLCSFRISPFWLNLRSERFFDKPSFVILNQNCEAFIIALCFSFVIFNAESICSPARLFDNSVNKAPRFRFGKQLLYIYSVRN